MTTPKQEWAERMADRIAEAVDRLARAHGMNDEGLAETRRIELVVELTSLIAAVSTHTHAVALDLPSPPQGEGK